MNTYSTFFSSLLSIKVFQIIYIVNIIVDIKSNVLRVRIGVHHVANVPISTLTNSDLIVNFKQHLNSLCCQS